MSAIKELLSEIQRSHMIKMSMPWTTRGFLVRWVFETRDGVIVAVPGWDEYPGSFPFHYIKGEVRPSGSGWSVGSAKFGRIEHGDALSPEFNENYRVILQQDTSNERLRCLGAVREHFPELEVAE